MITNNEGFICVGCDREVQQAKKTSRNHCPFCFLSLHVDTIPGDRQETCHGCMIPLEYFIANGTTKIHFVCVECFAEHRNKIASDDELGRLDENVQRRRKKYKQVSKVFGYGD